MLPTLVLAAGLGTRIRSIAGGLPKPLIPFGGQPILVHNLRWLRESGVNEVWINLHFAADAIRDVIGDGSTFGLTVNYLFEPELLGTAGALANLGDRFDQTMAVVYGDNLVRFDLGGLVAAHRRHRCTATLTLFDRDLHRHTGIAGGRVELTVENRVRAFVEGASAPEDGRADLVNAGVYLVEPALRGYIPAAPADFGRDVFPAMRRRNDALYGYVMEPGGYCLGLDTPESYAVGQSLLDQQAVTLA